MACAYTSAGAFVGTGVEQAQAAEATRLSPSIQAGALEAFRPDAGDRSNVTDLTVVQQQERLVYPRRTPGYAFSGKPRRRLTTWDQAVALPGGQRIKPWAGSSIQVGVVSHAPVVQLRTPGSDWFGDAGQQGSLGDGYGIACKRSRVQAAAPFVIEACSATVVSHTRPAPARLYHNSRMQPGAGSPASGGPAGGQPAGLGEQGIGRALQVVILQRRRRPNDSRRS